MKPRPDDFAVQYEWREGTVPPPHHYAYTIAIGPGADGMLRYQPGYDFQSPPVWIEAFAVDFTALDDLYRLAQPLLGRRWAEVKDRPVGGELESATFTVEGQTHAIPSVLNPRDRKQVQAVYAAIRALAPRALWQKLEAQRQAYINANT
jgi:hypothetical protein